MNTVVVALNVLTSLGAVVSSVVGVVKPAAALRPSEEVTSGVHFYTRAYAVRAIPLGLVTAFVLLWGPAAAVTPLLVVSGLAQAGDSVLAAMRRNLGLTLIAGLVAILHLLTAALWS